MISYRLKVNVYLNKGEVNDEWSSATKYGVCTIFSTMAHAVMTPVSGNDYFLACFLKLSSYLFLGGLPEQLDCWKQFLLQVWRK